MINTNRIKSINPDLSEYPAFKWCTDYGTDWYLPAANEFESIYSNKSKLNAVLSNLGPTLSGEYWSSSEAMNYGGQPYSYSIYLENSSFSIYEYNSKTDQNYIRAVHAL